MAKVLRKDVEREPLTAALAQARARTDDLLSLLRPGALLERPVPERHRLIFYLGHLEAFDWNLVAKQGFGLEPFDEAFDKLFAFGIDPVGGGLPNEPPSAWPDAERILAYNRRVRDLVDECFLGKRSLRSDVDEATLFHMSIEHRLMHAETLAYLLHQLPYDRKLFRSDPPHPPAATPPGSRMIPIPEGIATLGRSRAEGRFGWDNEFETVEARVPAFSIGEHKVTNRRFREFLESGGYARHDWWTDDAWAWLEEHRIEHPVFWIERGGTWRYRGMFGEAPMVDEAPVYVSHAEAAAFARWAGGRLPTEAQFHRAAYGGDGSGPREFPWGDEPPGERHGNFDFRRFEPTPVGAFPAGTSAMGVAELVGNGWEWTSSRFEPFPGFRPHPFYAGYSADFFDGHHFVMKGGSPRTAAVMLRRSFRNWFQPHYPYAYTTFRLVGG